MIRVFMIIAGILFATMTAHAEGLSSLALTDAEMQKLKKYFPAEDSERLVWKGDALTITLPLNKEKRLIFSTSMTADMKGALTTDQMRLLNDDKSLYLTALKPIPTTRIYVTLKETGEVVLIDLVTDEHASNTTQWVDIKKSDDKKQDVSVESATTENNSYVDLIRFAWQQVYAPERLLRDSPHYTRTAMRTQKFVSDLVYGDKVIAYPESSWVSGNRYITAVLLRNKYQHKAKVNIRKDLCGDWQAATLYPRSILKPYGDRTGDSTTLFLISNRPFGEMLGVCHGDA